MTFIGSRQGRGKLRDTEGHEGETQYHLEAWLGSDELGRVDVRLYWLEDHHLFCLWDPCTLTLEDGTELEIFSERISLFASPPFHFRLSRVPPGLFQSK